MKIGKPNYSALEITEQFQSRDYTSTIEKQITFNLLSILEKSVFYLFTDNYKKYVSDMVYEKENSSSFSNCEKNISVEYFDEKLELNILINIIDSRSEDFNNLNSILGSSIDGNFKLIIFYYKDKDGFWNIPVETIYLKDNSFKLIEIYKKRSFELKNSIITEEDSNHLEIYTSEIYDIFKNIKTLLSFNNMEYVNIPIPKKGLYYKIPHVFFREPNHQNKQNKSVLDEKKSLLFSRSIYSLKNKLFFK